MKIADYGKAITSYIESPTTAQKLKSKESANLLAEIDFSGMTVPQLRILYERYTGSGAPRDPRELIIELKRLMKNLDQDGIPFATGGRVHLAEGSEDIVEPPKSMQVDTTTKGIPGFTIDKFKEKAGIYILALHNRAMPLENIKSALNKFTKQGLEEGTFTIDEAIKVVKNLKFEVEDRAQKQRLRDNIISGTGTLSREDFAIGGGVIEGEDLETREGFAEPKLIIGGSRTAPEFRGKFGVRTSLTVPEDTPGYLGKTGEQVVFATEADAQRFIDEDIKKLFLKSQASKKRSPVIEARLEKIKNIYKNLKASGAKKIYLDDIIDALEGEKTVFGTGKRGIQTEQTALESRTTFKGNIKEALGPEVYDSLIKSQATDPRKLDAKKAKFNKLVLDVNRGDLPITALGTEERGTTAKITQYLTDANKKRFNKLYSKLKMITSRVSQPAETLTKEGIEELKKTTTKNFDAMMKKYPSSIERRTQVFKGGTRFYDAKSFALAQIGRHVAQGGTLYKHVGGDTMKDVKFRNTKTNKLITIRNMDMDSPEFKEAGKTYEEFVKLKNTKIDNPLTGEKITINNAIKQGSDGKDYLVIDHGDGIKNKPLNNLIITNQKQNLGFQLAGLTDDQKKLFYRNRLNLDDNVKRFTNYGQRLLGGSKYKTPKQTVADLIAKGEITTADQAPEPEETKTRKLFERFGERIKSGASDLKSKMDSSKFLTSKIPGGAAVLGPVDFALAMLGGAPVADAAASAGSYLIKDPYLGKAVNIPLALREIASYNDVDEMLRRATERREGIESMLESIPSRFKETINEAKGVKDETEEFVP
jgi:hypothetical protein